MIDVILTQRAQQDRNEIAYYLWKNLPGGNDEEVRAAFRIVRAEQAKVDGAVNQLRRLRERASQGWSDPQDHNTGLPLYHGLPDHKELQACKRAQHSRSTEANQMVGI